MVYVEPISPRVELYDKDKNQSSVKVTIPGFSSFTLSDATVAPNGQLVVAGCAHADIGGKLHCFVGSAARDGRVSPIVDTLSAHPK